MVKKKKATDAPQCGAEGFWFGGRDGFQGRLAPAPRRSRGALRTSSKGHPRGASQMNCEQSQGSVQSRSLQSQSEREMSPRAQFQEADRKGAEFMEVNSLDEDQLEDALVDDKTRMSVRLRGSVR